MHLVIVMYQDSAYTTETLGCDPQSLISHLVQNTFPTVPIELYPTVAGWGTSLICVFAFAIWAGAVCMTFEDLLLVAILVRASAGRWST